MFRRYGILIMMFIATSFVFAQGNSESVNVYTHRHYEADAALFKQFEAETGISVNVVTAGADELIQRLSQEGKLSPADILITADAGRLEYAKELGLLRQFDSANIQSAVPAAYRDSEGYWTGLTLRGRVVVYDATRNDGSRLSTYEALVDDDFADSLLVRSSANIYNQSLLASLIAHYGAAKAEAWAAGIVANMARAPQGNDRDQMKALVAGDGDYAIVNTYYVGLLQTSNDPQEQEVGSRIKVFFPNQEGRGTHVNVSGAGITAHAPNKENAVKLLEFLVTKQAQEVFAKTNFEYPVRNDVALHPVVAAWGEFKADDLNLSLLGEYNTEAVKIFDKTGWK
ncbi:MAG: Fe(3+) ABC transporter substrate-binding protein [Sphaerochaetaceae bacterium]